MEDDEEEDVNNDDDNLDKFQIDYLIILMIYLGR